MAARLHIAIRRPEWVAGSSEKPEVGVFTQTHSKYPPKPWDRIAVGERVLMKWSGGPVVARARVQGFRQLRDADADGLRATTAGFGLHDLTRYWDSLPPRFFGMAIYLEQEQWLDEPTAIQQRSYGDSWLVLESMEEGEVAQMATHESAAKARPSGRMPMSASLRFKVFRRDGFTCRYCGRRAPEVILHVDHVHPYSAGGSSSLDNLVTACSVCNLGKGATIL